MDEFFIAVGTFFKKHWYFLVGGSGLLLFWGSICKWKWVLQTEGDRPGGAMEWIYSVFGETGYRVAMAALGLFLIIFAAGYTILLSYI